LFDIDTQFCKESQTDKEKAWDKYMHEDCLLGNGPEDPFTRKPEFMKSISPFYKLEDLFFVWEPKHAFISDDETLGITTGTYTRSFVVDGEVKEKKGKYTTTWKKVEGAWKMVYDVGN
jgi:hypothetical protein